MSVELWRSSGFGDVFLRFCPAVQVSDMKSVFFFLFCFCKSEAVPVSFHLGTECLVLQTHPSLMYHIEHKSLFFPFLLC